MNIETKDDGRRPGIGYPDSCAYCFNKPGEPHKPDCHVPDRTVVVEFKTRMVVEMPRVWDEETINFSMNESSACSSRYVEQLFLETEQEEGMCHICSRTEMKFIRDATEEDHKELSYLPEDKKADVRKRLLKEE